jgi:3-deoxy-manno-octulosonate cytidylyltransferase (CMP-KDO synthetase)
MKTTGIIPARMASSRYPGKPLVNIGGLTMIEHVYRRTLLSHAIQDLYVATPDRVICEAVKAFGGKVIMTSDRHERGTDRVAEAAQDLDGDIIANIQGDEPLLIPDLLDAMVNALHEDIALSATNLMVPIENIEEFKSPNSVKVVINAEGFAMYFSRQPIPTQKTFSNTAVYRQLGLYAFRKNILMRYRDLPQMPLEQLESVDMLRLLEHGIPLKMVLCRRGTIGVDTPSDRQKAEEELSRDELWPLYRLEKSITP